MVNKSASPSVRTAPSHLVKKRRGGDNQQKFPNTSSYGQGRQSPPYPPALGHSRSSPTRLNCCQARDLTPSRAALLRPYVGERVSSAVVAHRVSAARCRQSPLDPPSGWTCRAPLSFGLSHRLSCSLDWCCAPFERGLAGDESVERRQLCLWVSWRHLHHGGAEVKDRPAA